MRRSMRILTVATVIVAATLAATAPAFAETAMAVAAPGQADPGEMVPVIVTVTEDGIPLAGAVVVLSREASFAGVSGYMEVARATTDDQGIADLSFMQRSADAESALRVEVVEGSGPPLDFVVVGGSGSGDQIFMSEVGVDFPGIGGWLLIALLGVLWLIIFSTVIRLRRVAGEGKAAKSEGKVVVFALPGVVFAIAAVLLTVLIRNPATHANINGPDFGDRVPHSHLGEVTPLASPGLDPSVSVDTGDVMVDGSRTFFGLGCASCHGLDAVSGVVGGDITDPVEEGLDEFVGDVRRGPEGMPSFPTDTFSDDQLALVHSYLTALLLGG